MCKCFGHEECFICYKAMIFAFEEQYQSLKKIGMKDYLEAKEFRWEFYAERDKENAEELAGDGDPSQWTY